MMRMHEQQKVDLVQDTTDISSNPFHVQGNGPDVVESGAQNPAGGKQAEMDLLIDFSSEPGIRKVYNYIVPLSIILMQCTMEYIKSKKGFKGN